MKKKLLFVIDSLVCGGAEKSLVSLLPLLNQDKYEIHLWMLHRGGDFESLIPPYVVVQDNPSYNYGERLKKEMAQIRYSITYRLKRIIGIREHGAETLWKTAEWAYKVPQPNYDVAVAYQQGLPTYLVATKIKARKKIAWINADIFKAGYNPLYNSSFYNQIDTIVPVSVELENILRKYYSQYKEKFFCVYDIINPELIKVQAVAHISEEGLFDKDVTFVTTGRLASPKNYPLAVETAKILKDKGLDFKWLFIGEGDERSRIEKLITKYHLEAQVTLLGMITNPYPYMSRCNVYVQTSSFEGFGLTIAEAKILGKPVVSTNFDVVHDQLVHEQNGLIADMTPESVADNIIRLVVDENLRNSIISNLKNETNTTYVTEVEKVEKLLDAN